MKAYFHDLFGHNQRLTSRTLHFGVCKVKTKRVFTCLEPSLIMTRAELAPMLVHKAAATSS